MPASWEENKPSDRANSDSDSVPSNVPVQHTIQIVRNIFGSWQQLRILDLFKDRNMIFAFPIFMIGVFRGVSLRVLLQYTSVRFGWKLSQVSTK